MAARRGRSQARRSGGSGGLPGWAWLILGVVLALVAVLVAPRLFKPDTEDGFFRPRPNPDARPAVSAIDEDAPPVDGIDAQPPPPAVKPVADPEYDFYTVLPAQEVAMTDAELAASAREEAARQKRLAEAQRQAQPPAAPAHPDAADPAQPAPATSCRPAPSAPPATPRRSRRASPCSASARASSRAPPTARPSIGCAWAPTAARPSWPKPSRNSATAVCRRWRSRPTEPPAASRRS